MKRIENHVSAIKDAARKYFLGGDDAGILQLCGGTGMGKTAAARHYVKIHGGYYFSFRHLDAAIAPQIFLPGSRDWDAFFKIIAKRKNRPVIFFDDTDDRNDKDIFFSKLSSLHRKAFVVLLCRGEMKLDIPYTVLQLKPVTLPELLAKSKQLDQMNALRLIAMTDGNPGLLSAYDTERSFAENLRCFFTEGSAFLRHGPEELSRHFRSPESYNTLLYGMATGHNRIVQLAEFSGYPKNKCDKYLKALDAAGFIETARKEDENGQLRTHYYPKGAYLKIWYRLYFPYRERFAQTLSDEALEELLTQIDDIAAKPYFRSLCRQWMARFEQQFYCENKISLNTPTQREVTVNGCGFDFVQHDRNNTLYMKIWDDLKTGFPKELFRQIETATTAARPFYDNFYFLFSVLRPCNYVEALQKHENMIVITLGSLLSKNSEELFSDVQRSYARIK